MIVELKGLTKKRYFHIIVISSIIVMLLFILGVIILKYNVEGETNMPFELTKMSIISSTEGIDLQAVDTKWAFDVYQSNDIYLYISKNESYNQTEAIQSVKIDNIKVNGNKKGNIKIYKPDQNDQNKIFKNVEENVAESITYEGSVESIMKQLRISNQGGLIAFRCSLDNLATYTSNEEEINHFELLKKVGIAEEDLKAKLTFDLSIILQGGRQYKSTIDVDIPIEGIVEKGTTSKEITDLKDVIFKRIES